MSRRRVEPRPITQTRSATAELTNRTLTAGVSRARQGATHPRARRLHPPLRLAVPPRQPKPAAAATVATRAPVPPFPSTHPPLRARPARRTPPVAAHAPATHPAAATASSPALAHPSAATAAPPRTAQLPGATTRDAPNGHHSLLAHRHQGPAARARPLAQRGDCIPPTQSDNRALGSLPVFVSRAPSNAHAPHVRPRLRPDPPCIFAETNPTSSPSTSASLPVRTQRARRHPSPEATRARRASPTKPAPTRRVVAPSRTRSTPGRATTRASSVGW